MKESYSKISFESKIGMISQPTMMLMDGAYHYNRLIIAIYFVLLLYQTKRIDNCIHPYRKYIHLK